MSEFKNIKETVPFNPILFNLVRLDIVSTLDDEPPIPFTELREVLALTDSNLSRHLSVLERHEIVSIHKSFKAKKPHTTIELTLKGEDELQKLKEWFYHAFLE